jgi:5-methylcytosine-specific restriction protein A
VADLFIDQHARGAIPKPCFSRRMRIGRPFNSKPVPTRYGKHGHRICRWCDRECPNGRRTFCRDPDCVHQFLLRTDAGYVRRKVQERDGGVCLGCGINAELERRRIQRWTPDHGFWQHVTQGEWSVYVAWVAKQRDIAVARFIVMGFPSPRDHWWESHHIVPVIEGGGCCGLENYRTMCIPCHKKETAKLAQRRAFKSRRPPIGGHSELTLGLECVSVSLDRQ